MSIISFAYAVVEPLAVMIKVGDTTITLTAMFRSGIDVSFTNSTHVFKVYLNDLKTFSSEISLLIDIWISWIYLGASVSSTCNCK